jgi:hypothetical protein
MNALCAPAIIYLVFSLTQIIIDTIKGLYNTAFVKFIVMIMCTLLLNILCESGLTIISWFIVFIPFIFMTFIVSLILYILGLNQALGNDKQQFNVEKNNNNETYNIIVPTTSKNN